VYQERAISFAASFPIRFTTLPITLICSFDKTMVVLDTIVDIGGIAYIVRAVMYGSVLCSPGIPSQYITNRLTLFFGDWAESILDSLAD